MRAVALTAALCAAGCLDFDALGGLYHPDAAVDDLAVDDAAAADLSPTDAPTGCPAASGPITFIDQTTVTQGQPLTATLHIPHPPSAQPCDVMLLMFYADLNSVLTDPPGWNKFLDLPSSQNFETRFYWRVATDAEPASYDLTMNPAQFAAANLVVYRGVDTIAPIEASLSSACHSPPTTLNGFSPQHGGDEIVMMCTCDTGFGVNPMFVDPSGMTLRSLTLATATWDAPQASGAVPQRTPSCTTSSELCCIELALTSF